MTYLPAPAVQGVVHDLSEEGAATHDGEHGANEYVENEEPSIINQYGFACTDIPGALALREDAAICADVPPRLVAGIRVVHICPVLIRSYMGKVKIRRGRLTNIHLPGLNLSHHACQRDNHQKHHPHDFLEN